MQKGWFSPHLSFYFTSCFTSSPGSLVKPAVHLDIWQAVLGFAFFGRDISSSCWILQAARLLSAYHTWEWDSSVCEAPPGGLPMKQRLSSVAAQQSRPSQFWRKASSSILKKNALAQKLRVLREPGRGRESKKLQVWLSETGGYTLCPPTKVNKISSKNIFPRES